MNNIHRLHVIATLACALALELTTLPRAVAQGTTPAHVAPVASVDTHGLVVMRNPFNSDAAAIAQGRDLFDEKACSSCHGAQGGGGMCPSLVNGAWVYGSDDTTLFNLIKRGSVGLRAAGYVRGTQERVAGDMPPLGSLVSDDEAWKLLAWVRSLGK